MNRRMAWQPGALLIGQNGAMPEAGMGGHR